MEREQQVQSSFWTRCERGRMLKSYPCSISFSTGEEQRKLCDIGIIHFKSCYLSRRWQEGIITKFLSKSALVDSDLFSWLHLYGKDKNMQLLSPFLWDSPRSPMCFLNLTIKLAWSSTFYPGSSLPRGAVVTQPAAGAPVKQLWKLFATMGTTRSNNKVGELITWLPLSGFNDNEIKSIFTGPVWAIAIVLIECFTFAFEIRRLL